MSFTINEAMAEIKRGTFEIIDEQKIEKLIAKFLETGQRFKVKAGFDPTAPDLHLGHTVLIQKLAVFQRYGAIVQFLIGDFTATIGDPTGKSTTRKILSSEDIAKNATTYEEQVFKIIDPKLTDVVFNSSWLRKLGADGLLELTTHLTVARMLERDDFSKRYSSNTPISISEFIYPLLQGYDSVVLKSDVEIGGSDQKFNLLMGRSLQKIYDTKKEQAVLMMPILEGLDGVMKMSKSLGNYIALKDGPNEMFAKILSISDELMWRYYELLSSKTLSQINTIKQSVVDGLYHPKKAKEDLAIEIVTKYHTQELANNAQREFEKIFKNKDIPTDMEVFEFDSGVWIATVLVGSKLVNSTTQAKRDIKQGAVRIDQQKIDDDNLKLQAGEYIVQKGKKGFAKIIVKQG